MNTQNPLLKFIFYSLYVHTVLFLAAVLYSPARKVTRFVVLGAHSAQEQQVLFKIPRQPLPTPRTNQNTSTSSTKASIVGIPSSQAKSVATKTKPKPVDKKSKKKPAEKAQKKSSIQQKVKTSAPITETKKPKTKIPKGKAPKPKKDIKKNEPVSSPPVKKTLPPPALPPVEKEKSSALQLEPASENALDHAKPGDVPSEGPSENGQDKELARKELIQNEVARLWRPPLGVAKGTICRVRFTIHSSGCVQTFKIIKPSGVLLYDLSITRVAKQLCFDKRLWNATFEVDFCQ